MKNKTKKERGEPLVDYGAVDKASAYQFRGKRLKAAKKAGYKFISEHVVNAYRITGSLRRAGEECGISTTSVRKTLIDCGVKVKGPGGKVWTKISDDHVRMIRKHERMTHRDFIRVAKKLTEELGTPISSETVRFVWTGRTHTDVK